VSGWQAFVLGMVQGLGEFLPISSSGHLILVPWLLGWPEHSLAFDVALHLGTLAAVIGAFWKDWLRLVTAFVSGSLKGRPFGSPDARLLGLIVLATIPGAVVGKLLDEWAETTFRSPLLVAGSLAVVGVVLFVADRRARATGGEVAQVRLGDALIIGCAQALAIVPGVSRSGATISAALLLGYKREDAARFSFLLATPITAGAALIKVPQLVKSGAALTPLAIGIATAAVFGLLAIRVLLAYVRTRDYRPFVFYRWALAALVVSLWLVRANLVG
jgi:undecaprenyl-diphosphatase